ncbi:MAG TPA: hypothetical protein VNL92_06700, partial [Dehalococcoidia bacterium]|nr:hypothetical protein [Dehalococcoidia bacterium]
MSEKRNHWKEDTRAAVLELTSERRRAGYGELPIMLPRALLALLVAVSTPRATIAAQGPDTSVRVAIGFGVDTLGTPNHEVFALWRAYLARRPTCGQPSPLWSAAERARWPGADLLCSFVYQGFSNFTVLHLAPAVGLDSTYLIRTLVARVSGPERAVWPLAVYRVYATREGGRWVLANALPRLTRRWHRETIGRITFVFPPTRSFVRARAESSAAFVDSLARAFDVPAPASISYYFTDDLIETLGALGLDFFPLASDTAGGRSLGDLVFVGSSSDGEGN